MSSRAAARGKAAANSIRLTSRTSKAVATSRASPSRCFLFCRGSRAARSAPIAAATVAIPPIRKPPQARRITFKHRKVQRARKSDGWQGLVVGQRGVERDKERHRARDLLERAGRLGHAAKRDFAREVVGCDQNIRNDRVHLLVARREGGQLLCAADDGEEVADHAAEAAAQPLPFGPLTAE